MSNQIGANEIREKAQWLLESEQFGSPAVRTSGRVEQPIPVLGPIGHMHSWFVPVTVGKLLAGFFEFQPDGTLIRYSSFQRHEDSLDGCPASESWIDARSIQRRLNNDYPDDEVKELYLSYDRVPSRLAWKAVLESPGGETRTFYVAGNNVWQSASPDAGERSFGGQ